MDGQVNIQYGIMSNSKNVHFTESETVIRFKTCQVDEYEI